MRILIAIFLLLTISGFSQEQFTGVGKLKIGLSYQEILTALDLSEKKLINPNEKRVNWLDVYDNEKDYLLIYDPEKTPKDVSYLYSKSPLSKIIMLAKYEVAGIKITKIKLTFYKDILIDVFIKSPGSEFSDAVEAKYGKGELKVEKKEVICSSIYGNTNYEETTYRTHWNKGQEIEVESIFSQYRDSKCKAAFLSYTRIFHEKMYSELTQVNKDFAEAEDQKQLSEKKEKLADF